MKNTVTIDELLERVRAALEAQSTLPGRRELVSEKSAIQLGGLEHKVILQAGSGRVSLEVAEDIRRTRSG